MKLTYDPKHNIGYIRLHEKTACVETIRISDEMNVDIAPDGTVYGIELLNANEQLRAEDDGSLIVINATSGQEAKFRLAVHEESTQYGTGEEKEPEGDRG